MDKNDSDYPFDAPILLFTGPSMKHIGACSAMSSRAIKGIMKRYDIV
jgi:hypothetical protein